MMQRDLMGMYTVYPLISKEALRLYYDLNKNGNGDFETDGVIGLRDYTLKERVTSTYLMNTMNFGQSIT